MKELLHPQQLEALYLTASLAVPWLMALTHRQRKAILERDDYQSQMRHYSEEKGWHTSGDDKNLQVHHVTPQGWAKRVLNWPDDKIDSPRNLITVSEREHVGRRYDGTLTGDKDFVIHPDTRQAFREHRKGNKGAFKDMVEGRKAKVDQGDKYWNTDHDVEMKQTAIERTDNAAIRGWKWPLRRKK